MSDLKDRASKAREKIAEEVKSFESASEQLANQEVEIDSYEVSERVQIDDISLDSSYFCADVEMPQVKHVMGAVNEYKKLLDEALAEIDRLNEAPSTESPGKSGSVFFKEYYDELLQACAECDETRIAEHVDQGPELLRSVEIPCRIPQPQVTVADTERINNLIKDQQSVIDHLLYIQRKIDSEKGLLKTLASRFGIESIDDMIS